MVEEATDRAEPTDRPEEARGRFKWEELPVEICRCTKAGCLVVLVSAAARRDEDPCEDAGLCTEEVSLITELRSMESPRICARMRRRAAALFWEEPPDL